MADKKKLEHLAYILKDLPSLRNLFAELGFDFVDEPVNKKSWSDSEKEIVLESKIVAKKGDYRIYYLQTNTDSLKHWKSIATKIIKENHGFCLICSHNPSGFKWVFSSLSKEFSKSFTETRHVPIEIRPDAGVPNNFVDFLDKIRVGKDFTPTSISTQISEAFDTFAIQIHNELTVNVFEALKMLSEGIVGDKNNNLSLTDEILEEIREPIFILLYRIIFILYAEDRGIFPVDNKIYQDEFSLKWIKEEWLLKSANTKKLAEYDVEKRVKKLFRLIEIGSEELDYVKEEFFMRSYYGRIFDRKINNKLEEWNIPNSNFLEMLSLLTRTRDKKGNYFFLDYSALETRHLGSIYEHLLEFHLHVKDKKIAELPDPQERKTTGSYYTPKFVVDYITKNSIEPVIESIIEKNSDKQIQIEKILSLKILDPAMGSGHFLVGAIEYIAKRLCEIEYDDIPEQSYIERKRDVVRRCIYGVDINPLAVDLARLSLWLETLSSEKPLSFLSAHLKSGNSLIGSKIKTLFEKQTTLFESQKGRTGFIKNLEKFLMFENLEDDSPSAVKMKLEEYAKMQAKGTIYYELKFLLDCKVAEYFGIKVPNLGDYRAKIGENSLDFFTHEKFPMVKKLGDNNKFFHWELEFPQIFYDENGVEKSNPGFDIIIGNPPWEIWKPEKKDFFSQFDERITQSTPPKTREKIIKELMKNSRIKSAWENWEKFVKDTSKYYTKFGFYPNCFDVVDQDTGKKISSDVDLYKIFLERSYQLTKKKGMCGLILSSGFLTTLGAKGLRTLIFENTLVKEIADFENKYGLFKGIHRSKHFLLLVCQTDSTTTKFKASFSLHHSEQLENNDASVQLLWKKIKEYSPQANALLSFKNKDEYDLVDKIYRFPLLGKKIPERWNIELRREIDLSLNPDLFGTEKSEMPLFSGDMIHQYTLKWKSNKYFVNIKNACKHFIEKEKRKVEATISRSVSSKSKTKIVEGILGRKIKDDDILLDSDFYRLGYRALSQKDNERTLISQIIPKKVFCANSLILTVPKSVNPNHLEKLKKSKNLRELYTPNYTLSELCILQAFFNSFVVDYIVRKKVLENLNMFIIYELPIPRLIKNEKYFNEIVQHVALLLCQDKESFTDLQQELKIPFKKITDEQRIKIRAEIEAYVAKVYELNKNELEKILNTFAKDKKEFDFLSLNKQNKTKINFDEFKSKILTSFNKL